MASQTLRPHRSPSPTPSPSSTPINPSNPAKLTRQSLGPPPTSSGAARGFAGLGLGTANSNNGSAPAQPHPRHVSSSVALGLGSSGRESLSPRPSLGTNGSGNRAVSSSARPSSEFLPGGATREARTPEAEQIDQWFKHLASWEATLEEMAAASTDQNFTEELGAIEQWFRVLSEAERTAALYSLLQHSTPVQIRFFLSVLHHMAQSDPMTALLSPNPTQSGFAAQMEKINNLKSPSAGGGSGFPGSPTGSQFLNPDDAHKAKIRQNRISAPGTLQPTERWQQQLDQVLERGPSPDNLSSRSKSPAPDPRPKSTDFSGKAGQGQHSDRSPRTSGFGLGGTANSGAGVGLGIDAPSSPFLNNASWASMVNTPMAPMFTDPNEGVAAGLNMANISLAANQSRIALEDARKYRRPTGSRNVSAQYNDDGEMVQSQAAQPGRATSPLMQQYGQFARSPILDQYGLGLGDPSLAGLGMNLANLNLSNPLNANAAQMMALQHQLNTAASFAQAGYGSQPSAALNAPRGTRPPAGAGRRSPLLGSSARHSPSPQVAGAAGGGGGGAGGGAGVAGPDDVDLKVLEDVSNWLRVLRLHKYTTTFEKANWKDMVHMTDADLQDKGVAALGARTKFLKVFYNVRERFDIPHPAGSEQYAPGKDDK